jgi:hypothetical protein
LSFTKKDQIIWRLYNEIAAGFVPDKVEIKLERHENEYELIYEERFTYMPSDIAEVIITLTKKAWEKACPCPFLEFQLLDNGLKVIHKGKPDSLFRTSVNCWVVNEAIRFVASNQQEVNEMIRSLCSERANENLCGKPLPAMECKGLKIHPNTIREWDENVSRETNKKIESAKV